MFRAIFELLLTIFVVMVGRAILTSMLKGFVKASSDSFGRPSPTGPTAGQTRSQQQEHPSASATTGRDLHKDPVCGTYVSESTGYRRQTGGQTFYYCSASCKEKHALVAS